MGLAVLAAWEPLVLRLAVLAAPGAVILPHG
jgi:hypothetical protein